MLSSLGFRSVITDLLFYHLIIHYIFRSIRSTGDGGDYEEVSSFLIPYSRIFEIPTTQWPVVELFIFLRDLLKTNIFVLYLYKVVSLTRT